MSGKLTLIALFVAVLLPATVEAANYHMLVDHGTGWSEAGTYRTLEDCKKDAVIYAAKHSARAGCIDALGLAQWKLQLQRQQDDIAFQSAASQCAKEAKVQIIHKPGGKVTILGTTQQRFDFDKCMADSGHPTENR